MGKIVDKYIKNKERILEEVGEGILSPFAISEIIDVPYKNIDDIEELKGLKGLSKLDDFEEPFTIMRSTTIEKMEKYGISNLLFIYYLYPAMNYFFVMDNNKSFRVMVGELRSSQGKNITKNLLSVFDKFKMEELRDRETWVPVKNRFEIMDI